MSNSITLHENMGGQPIHLNPNVWPGNSQGQPITPKDGEVAHLWAKVKNNGTQEASNVSVSFYLCIPAGNLAWPVAAHGSNSIASLAAGAEQKIMCSVPWIPDSSTGAHKCIVAVASCLDCPAPSTTAGQPVDGNNIQIGQHNITIHHAGADTEAVYRSFHVQPAAHNGYVEITREPLADNALTLHSRGVDPGTEESPEADSINIQNISKGTSHGNRMDFKAGEYHELLAKIKPGSAKSGTAAIYHIRHYENGKPVGGVSQVIQH